MARQLRWIKLFELEILPDDDFIKSVQVNKKRICLIKTEDRWFATQAKCPHAGADLSQGWCKNGKLICPFHRYEYDLQSGKGAPGQGDYIDTYPLQIRRDGIYIGWKESWFKQLIKRIWRPKFSK
jgi:3-phenylpropionate/trans-cinnamate dioxygenase ferredoxin subunit